MNIARRPRVVVLGLMSKMPVAGVVWQTAHYLVGFERLGCEVFYVEAHGCTPRNFILADGDDGHAKAAEFIESAMRRFGFADRWAYDPLWDDDRKFGMSDTQLRALFASADLVINLHGGTHPTPEICAGGPLVYLETDPVELQIELHHGLPRTLAFLEPHAAFFTFGENLGHADCKLPLSRQFHFKPTRQPVVLDFWPDAGAAPAEAFTTIGNFRQPYREIHFRGEVYQWSKHAEFMKFIDVPERCTSPFELALSSYTEEDRAFLTGKGWRVRHGLDVSTDIDCYRDYVAGSRGEFTVAKDQNVRLRSGWFSDRSATYLAAGRPVITQDTGFGNVLPTGLGLFAFSSLDEVSSAVEAINADYARHSRVAREIARDYFNYDVVLGRMLDDLGVATQRARPAGLFPAALPLTPLERRPIRLPEATVRTVRVTPLPITAPLASKPRASIVIVTFNNLLFTRLCLASVLAHTDDAEVIVVDNASTDGTPDFLRDIAARNPRVRPTFNDRNAGFACANNVGLAAARGDALVLLNNDTIVPPGWLPRLLAHLGDPAVGAAGPMTNRIGNEAETDVCCDTYGDFLRAAEAASAQGSRAFDIPTLTMFCLAMRRDVFEKAGPLDERFTIGLLEDDDYSMRLRKTGLRLVCAEDVLVFHFGQASFGQLVAGGEYAKLLAANQRLFEEKWGEPWTPYQRRRSARYEQEVRRLREVVDAALPPQAEVLVVSRGDNELLLLGSRHAAHFPQDGSGGYAGCYPADAAAALAQLAVARRHGAEFLVVPAAAAWWLTHYRDFGCYLREQCEVVAQEDAATIFRLRAS